MYNGGMTWGREDYKANSNAEDLSPEYTDAELDHIEDGTMLTIAHLIGPLEALNDERMTVFKRRCSCSKGGMTMRGRCLVSESACTREDLFD
jgi:hypothetical protein